jgi:hypothetical protein
MRTKDQQGLYFQGEFKANTYSNAVKELYGLNEVAKGFCVNEDFKAKNYSVVDANGVQHIYELSPKEFYRQLMKLN